MFNTPMLYLLVKAFHYRQLQTVNQELLNGLLLELEGIAEVAGFTLLGDREGHFLYSLGDERNVRGPVALERILLMHRILQDHQDELYGFNMLICLLHEKPEGIQKIMEQTLLLIQEDNKVWLDQKAKTLFAGYIETRKVGGFYHLISRSSTPRVDREQIRNIWDGEAVVRKVLAAITVQQEERTPFVFISGSSAAERKTLVDAVLSRFLEGTGVHTVPRLFTMYRRRSTIHPFLNSLDPDLLPEVSRYLRGPELKIWNKVGDLLLFLQPGPWNGQELCPDHLETDFYLAYQLYLNAYLRLMEEKLLPGLLICENLERYHAKSLKALALMIQEFSNKPGFMMIFSSDKKQIPAALANYEFRKFSLRLLTLAGIRNLVSRTFPGLSLPEKGCRSLRRISGGNLNILHHLLQYLNRQGGIKKQEGSYYWLVDEQDLAELPADPLTVSLRFTATLSEELLRLLHIVYLQAGLLDRQGLVKFLLALDWSEELIRRSLGTLIRAGLISYGQYIVPLYPALGRKLAELIPQQEVELNERFRRHLTTLWQEGNFRQLVLLFFFLLYGQQDRGRDRSAAGPAPGTVSQLATEVLIQLLDRKLAELDLRGARLIVNHPTLLKDLAADDRRSRDLTRFLYAIRLRMALLAGDMKKAEALRPQSDALIDGFDVSAFKGRVLLELARLYQMKGEMPLALDWAKKALFQFQNARHPAGELLTTTELGSIMLAEGNLEEALEYLSFFDHRPEQGESFLALGPDEIRNTSLRAVTLYLAGNLSLAHTELLKGRARAASLKRREWELFLTFLEARIFFDLGDCAEAEEVLQQGLGLARIYSEQEAQGVFYAWLGRVYAYQGLLKTARGILQAAPDSAERQFFIAEMYYFSGEHSQSIQACAQALKLVKGVNHFPGERVLWSHGFAAVEGRCFSLFSGNSLLLRLIRSFQAYLLGLTGSGGTGIEQLHAITRQEKLPGADPYVSLYHYFYACTLPEVRMREVDDSLTVLNKGLKLLQLRASHINDSSVRFKYLSKNFWNARLMEEARRKKLL